MSAGDGPRRPRLRTSPPPGERSRPTRMRPRSRAGRRRSQGESHDKDRSVPGRSVRPGGVMYSMADYLREKQTALLIASLSCQARAEWARSRGRSPRPSRCSRSNTSPRRNPSGGQGMGVSRRVLGEKNDMTLACYNNLAAVLKGLGKYTEAEALDRRSLELSVQVLRRRSIPYGAWPATTWRPSSRSRLVLPSPRSCTARRWPSA